MHLGRKQSMKRRNASVRIPGVVSWGNNAMQRLTLLLLISFSLAAPLAGQSMMILSAGTNIANWGGADALSPGATMYQKSGMNLGVSVLIPITDNMGIQLGGSYSSKGKREGDGGVISRIRMDYFEVPVLLRTRLPSYGTALTYHYFVGPAVAFLTKCSVASDPSAPQTSCTEADLLVKNLDLGVLGGVGVDVEVSDAFTLVIDVVYNFGLSSIDKAGNDVKNRAFTMQAGIGFPIG